MELRAQQKMELVFKSSFKKKNNNKFVNSENDQF